MIPEIELESILTKFKLTESIIKQLPPFISAHLWKSAMEALGSLYYLTSKLNVLGEDVTLQAWNSYIEILNDLHEAALNACALFKQDTSSRH